MVKLIGILSMFLFLGCTSQNRKQSAFFELTDYSWNVILYNNIAVKLPATLSSPEFLAPFGVNTGFLLEHSTGHLPHNSEIDVPIVYADFYFLESII